MSGRFNWLKMRMSLNIVFFLFSQVASSGQIQNVPVVPNDSIITGNKSQQGQASMMNSLGLKDYPKLFEENVIIVVRENATEVENECAIMIKENLKELTGNEPIIKNDIELSESDKKACNLILVGTPTTNRVLQEIYGKEYPGEKKAILEILENPWNCNKALLIVAASGECGVKTMSKTLT
ncbi:unnamed protein product, partial [marine sediment metagenome]